MKKTLILAVIMLIIPFATFAHGGEFADADEQAATKEEMQMEQQNHEQMKDLMKEFMVNGTLSQEDAETVVILMGNKMSGSKMGMSSVDSGNMMEGSADHDGDMMGGGNMMSMNLLHALVGVTSIVWLIAGVMYLVNIRRQTSIKTTNE